MQDDLIWVCYFCAYDDDDNEQPLSLHRTREGAWERLRAAVMDSCAFRPTEVPRTEDELFEFCRRRGDRFHVHGLEVLDRREDLIF